MGDFIDIYHELQLILPSEHAAMTRLQKHATDLAKDPEAARHLTSLSVQQPRHRSSATTTRFLGPVDSAPRHAWHAGLRHFGLQEFAPAHANYIAAAMAAVIETAERPLTTLAPSPEPELQLNSLILSALSDLLDLAALTGDVFAFDVPWKHLTARPLASQDAIQTFKNAAFRQGYIKVAITKAFIDHETTLHALHPTGTITSSTYIHADHPGTTRTGRSERASITLALAFLDAALSRAHHLEKFLRRAFSLLNCRIPPVGKKQEGACQPA
eukprot:tig00020571_g11502.t1